MANQNQTTSGNGCSLEDCYTNLFALTDFGDINYRIYGLERNKHYNDPLEDPIFKAYSRIQDENMLCTWTRVPSDETDYSKPYIYNNFSKVLWLFWYGNIEPSSDLVAGLKLIDTGNWGQGLTYECRTMLFKALHNVLERCLMKKGFVRIGKWFLQPYRKALVECKNTQYSISFSFFLHGESTVCASLDVRQLSPVIALRSYHLDVCNKRQVQMPVVLSPYGLEAQLTGVSFDEKEFDTRKLINSWMRFFPLKFEETSQESTNSEDRSHVPPKLVEVICCGYRLRYPSCLILVIDSDLSESVKEYLVTERSNSREKPKLDSTPLRSAKNFNSYMGQRAIQRIQQDACIPLKSESQGKDCGSDIVCGSRNPFSYNIPSCKADCRCRRNVYRRSNHAASLRRQKMHRFHCQNHLLVQANDRLDEVDSNCDRNRTPPNLPANDPTMPTLSPQPPTLEQQGVVSSSTATTTVATVTTSASNGTPSMTNTLALTTSTTTSQLENGTTKSSTFDSYPPIPNHTIPPSQRADDSLGGSPTVSDTRNVPPSCSQLEPLMWPPLGVVENVYSTHELSKPPVIDRPSAPLSSPLSPDSDYKREPMHSWLDKCLQDLPFLETNRTQLSSSKVERSKFKSWLDMDMHNSLSNVKSNSDGSPCPKIPRYSSEQVLQTEHPYITKPILSTNLQAMNNSQILEESGKVLLPSMLKGLVSPPTHIFDSEDDDGVDNDTPLYNNHHRIVSSIGASINSSTGSGSIPSSELSRMFPTPPSLENHTSPIEQPSAIISSHVSNSTAVSSHGLSASTLYLKHSGSLPPFVESLKCGSVQGLHYQVPLSMHPQPDVVSESFERDWVFLNPSSSNYSFGSKFSSSNSNSISKRPSSLSYCHRDFYKRQHSPSPCSTPGDCQSSLQINNNTNNLPRAAFHNGPTTPGQSYPNVSSVESEKIVYSPAPFPNSVASVRSVQTPVGPDFSPASTPGSVLNRTYGSNCDDSCGANICSVDSSSVSHYNSHNIHNNRNQSADAYQLSASPLEAHSLYVNILLSDSMLNIFKDHNFDSCNICECTMSVQGGDIGLYLPGSGSASFTNQCKCGFSALMNKRYVEQSNLFIEDKKDVTGYPEKSVNKNLPSVWKMFLSENEHKNMTNYLMPGSNSAVPSPAVLDKLFCQLIGIHNEYGLRLQLDWIKHMRTINSYDEQKHSYEYEDACSVCLASLSQAQLDGIGESNFNRPDLINSSKYNLLHRSFFKRDLARLPENQNDQIRLLKTVRPWLQEAIGATRLLEACYTVDGPLTWKDFHQLAGRGSEETCEPQPLPYFAVSMENEGANVSPYAIKEWDLVGLEPFSRPKDIAYAVVLPNHDLIVKEFDIYFNELSRAYKSCRLGKHLPFSRKCPKGFIRIDSGEVFGDKSGSSAKNSHSGYQSLNDFQDWLQQFQRNESMEENLKVIQQYVNYCSRHVASVLHKYGVVDLEQFSTPDPINKDKNNPNSFTEHCWPCSLVDPTYQCLSNGSGPLSTSLNPLAAENDIYLLIYLVNPFTLTADYSDFYRLTTQALVSCSQTITEQLPDEWQKRVYFPQISLAEVLNNQDYLPRIKSMAFSSYTQIQRMLRPSLINANRTLTGMGPAGEKENISRKNEIHQKRCVYSPPYVLADEFRLDNNDKSGVLFCSYLVSEDQCWLLASCTDEKGALLKYASINIAIPDRHRRKNVSARRIGLTKLWNFIVSVVAQSANPWRLVIERFGRMGHGELKGWNGLLSRKNLLRVNQQFRDNCSLCNSSNQISQSSTCQDCSCLISACLISLELQSTIRVYPGAVKPEERASSGIPLNTPKDTSVTHILVFPTSTSASAQSDQFGQNDFDGFELDLGEAESIDMDVGDLFHPHSPTRDNIAIEDPHLHDSNKEYTDPQDAEANLMQQPLAIGFYLSTASPGPLPSWFWSACPQASRESPVCFKAALHLTTSLNQTEDNIGVPVHSVPLSSGLSNDSTSFVHLLDSTGTCDVLRFVLSSYNALSWLTIDPFTNDRRSCLPIHVLSLLQLYHAQNAFL